MVLTVTVFGVLAIVLLTAISAFFSSSELAVFSVPIHRIEGFVAAETPGSDALAALRADPHRFLVAALVSNNVANIAAASVATAVLIQFLPSGQAATGATVLTSFFVIVFGEIAPKSYAVANAERHALRVARPIVVIQRLLRPILYVFEVATAAVNRLTGGDTEFESYLSREEIATLVASGERTGVLAAEEGTMIRRILDLGEQTVASVMVPRTAMVTVAATADRETVLETIAREGVIRLPVYGETRDEIRGILDVRDVLAADDDSMGDLLSEPTFVPAAKPIDELLAEMRQEGHRLVIVVDEFGTVVGLATLEDVLEAVVGELIGEDEYDPIEVVDSDTAVVSGRATIEYVAHALALELPVEGPFETVGGLLTHRLGRVPSEGDRIELDAVMATVLEATATRVERVRLEWTPSIDGTPPIDDASAPATDRSSDAHTEDETDADERQ